jgi:predicted anti-sigma-YlaC factor YlaD
MASERPIATVHDLDVGPDYLAAVMPFDTQMLTWRVGPDQMTYFFLATPEQVRWLPPDDFDWAHVAPHRIAPAAAGRRWLRASVLLASARFVGQAIGPRSERLAVNLGVVTDERLAGLDTVDFTMTAFVAVAHLTVHDAAAPPPAP